MIILSDYKLEEKVGKKMAEYKAINPMIFGVLDQVLSDENFINKPEVMLCIVKILDKIKSYDILTLELIISPETFEEVKKELQGKNLYEEFLHELKKWKNKFSNNLVITIGMTLTLEISAPEDQQKAREYMGIILKMIRKEREK